jgi:hypothetical protein
MGGCAAAVGGEGVRLAEAHGGTVGRDAHPDLVIPWYYFYGVEMLFFQMPEDTNGVTVLDYSVCILCSLDANSCSLYTI